MYSAGWTDVTEKGHLILLPQPSRYSAIEENPGPNLANPSLGH